MQRRRALAGLAAASGGLLWSQHAHAQSGVPLHRRHTGDIGALTLVDATLDGNALRMMVDSGASSSLLAPARAHELGLAVIERVRVATLGGVQQVDRVRLGPLRIGGVELPVGTALVLDLHALLGPALAGVDGLIGMPAWRERPVALDFVQRRLLMGDDAVAQLQDAAPWPLYTESGLPVIELRLGNRAPARFFFDTGNAGALVVFEAHAARLLTEGPALPRLTVRELGGDVTAQLALIERIDSAGFSARDVPVAFEDGARARRGGHFDRLAGSFGTALLRHSRVLLDVPAARWQTAPAAVPPLPGGFGFALADSPLRVGAVIDGGPAATAGLRPGDRLLRIDGRSFEQRPAHEVWQALDGVDGAAFEWQRGSGAWQTVLRRERFFPRLR
jgi:membrane-associated protease RseP (regulator of RpoE activity)